MSDVSSDKPSPEKVLKIMCILILIIILTCWLEVFNLFSSFFFQGNKFEFKDDWGEQLVSKCSPVLVVFDITSEETRVLDGIPDHLSVGQVSKTTYLVDGIRQETE